MPLTDRLLGADERVSLQRDATLVKLKGEATASLDLAKLHESSCNYVCNSRGTAAGCPRCVAYDKSPIRFPKGAK